MQPKIKRRYNLRNRHNSSNNSKESSSDRSLRNAISISQPQDSCPTLTERNNTSCSVSNEIGFSIDRYQSLNFRNDTDNSSPDSHRKNGRDTVVSNKSCKRIIGETVENTANNSIGISNQRIDWDRNSSQQGSSGTFVEQTSNSEPKDSNEGNERQPELSKGTQSNQHNECIRTNWHNQFAEPFQFVKSNKNNQDPQTTSIVNHSAISKSHQLPDKQLRNSKLLIAQKGISNCPSEDSCDDSDSDSDEETNQRNDSRAKVSSKNQASKLQIIGGSTTQQLSTQQERCLTNSRTLASNKQKQTRDRNIFSPENRNQPRCNENTMLTQTTYSRSTVSADTSDTEIQTRSCRNQSHAIHEIRENSMERYEDSSNVRQPTVHFESATQLHENHTTNSTNEHFRNLQLTPNQRNRHININLPKTQLKTYNGDPLKWHEWYCYFKSKIHDNVYLSDAQKITYLQNALTDRAKESVFGYSYNGEFYHDAITELKRRFGRPQTIIAVYLDKLERGPKPSTDNPDSFISFAAILRQLVQTFLLHEFTPDLQSSAVLRVGKEKQSPAIIINWNENVILKELVNPNLIQFKDWIDKYAEACEDMPRTHQRNSFYERTHQRGKSEQRINARKNCPFCSQSHNLGKCQKFLSENVYCTYAQIVLLNIQKDNATANTDAR